MRRNVPSVMPSLLDNITHGTRSAEGSEAYTALLTVIETCRRRGTYLLGLT
jgi:hypothetical protein